MILDRPNLTPDGWVGDPGELAIAIGQALRGSRVSHTRYDYSRVYGNHQCVFDEYEVSPSCEAVIIDWHCDADPPAEVEGEALGDNGEYFGFTARLREYRGGLACYEIDTP